MRCWCCGFVAFQSDSELVQIFTRRVIRFKKNHVDALNVIMHNDCADVYVDLPELTLELPE